MRLRVVLLLLAGLLVGAGLFVVSVAAARPPVPVAQQPEVSRLRPRPLPSTSSPAGPTAPSPPATGRAATRTQPPPGPPRTGPSPAATASGPSPAATATGPSIAHTDAGPSALTRRLDDLLATAPLPDRLGVFVADGDGDEVFNHDGRALLVPASAEKLVTAAAALAALGPGFRYETRVNATADVGPDGVLTGDLILVGDGDPALATPLFGTQVEPDRPRTPLESLADQIVAAGVRTVTGRLLGDPTVLPDEPAAAGWLDRYFTELDATRVSGLTVEAGRQLYFEGEQLRARAAADPAQEAAASLYFLLLERGVTVAGGPAATRAPPATPVALGAVESPPLVDLLRHMIQHSENHMADAIFRTVGRVDGGAGTWAAAAAAAERELDGLGLDWDGVVLADGSGLSRDDRLSAGFLVHLDRGMTASSGGDIWQDLMAVAGESGTLRRRLVGTVAEHRLSGKTGSLEGVRSLAGSVAGPDGDRLHFAVVGNDLDGEAVQVVRALQDAVALALAQDLYACHEPLPSLTPPSPSPPAGDGQPAGAEPEQTALTHAAELIPCAA